MRNTITTLLLAAVVCVVAVRAPCVAQDEELAAEQAAFAEQVAAERAAAAAALERADSLASMSYAVGVQAVVDEDSDLDGVLVAVASRAPTGSRLRDPKHVDVTLPAYAEWDTATRRLWRADLSDAKLSFAMVAPGRYTVHQAQAGALFVRYVAFLATLAAEE